MTALTKDKYDREDLPSWMNKKTAQLVEAAVMVGWICHINSNGTVSIVSPDGRKRHSLNKRETVGYHRIMADITRHADKMKLGLALATVDMAPENAAPTLAALMGEEAKGRVVYELPPEKKTRTDSVSQVPVEVAEPESSNVEPPTLVSRQPMVASKSKHSGYVSETTDVLLYSDGTRDYGCRKCDYIANHRLGPSRHHANVHSEGRAETPEAFKADTDPASYRPRQSRIDALAAWLEEQCSGQDVTDMKTLARLALNWQHEQSKQGTEFAAEAEEMSADDTLVRIRRLLDTGQMAEQQARVAVLERDLLDSQRVRYELLDRAQQAERQAQRARDTLHTFVELARDLDTKEGSAQPDTDSQE